jgi:hypothetical protein
MNKKFLSAILFGALMVTSTGTFVSCKDYDDDIDSLNEKVDKLTKDLSELQAAAGKYVTAVKYDAATGKLTVTGGNGETFQLPMPAELPTYSLKVVDGKIQLLDGDKVVSEAPLPTTDAPAAFDPTLLKWNNGYLYYGDVKISGVEKPQSVGSITEVKDEETGEVIGYVIELDGKSATFSVVTDLKALVFEPELYYQGIEAIAVKSFVYKALTAKDVNADADNKDDAPVQETATTEVTPELSATYHMNPSTADVRNLVKEDLKFLAYDKEYARAADGVVVPEISKVEPKNGELTVWAKLTEGTIKDIENDDKVTVLALQANYLNGDNKRSVITSDYAAVKAVKITDLVLNNAKVAGESHLAVKAADAIQNAPEVKVAWNETVDLAEYVQTHYGAGDAHTKWDENAASGTVEKAGFSYSYELVGYIDGSNKTSQSAHAALKGSVLRPQLPKDGKAAEWGATEQNQATVGRMPLVRVFLNDNNSKKKVASVTINRSEDAQNSDAESKADTSAEESAASDNNGTSEQDLAAELYKGNVVKYLIVPEDVEVPVGLEQDMIIVKKPVDHTYAESDEILNTMKDLDLLDNVAAVGMKSKDCTVSEIADKMKAKDGEKNAEVAYAGTADKLKLKNFVKSEVNLALFTGDILPREDSEENAAKDTDKIADKDSKDTKETLTVEEKTEQFEELTEKLAMLGIPVFVDRSSEEKTELGKQEWIKVYGVLYGCEELTNEKFDAAVAAAEK